MLKLRLQQETCLFCSMVSMGVPCGLEMGHGPEHTNQGGGIAFLRQKALCLYFVYLLFFVSDDAYS